MKAFIYIISKKVDDMMVITNIIDKIMKIISNYTEILMILSIVMGLIMFISLTLILISSGKSIWLSIIPVYQVIVLFQVVGVNPFWLLTCLIPGVNLISIFILYIIVNFHLARSFNKSFSFGLGLCIIPYFFYPLIVILKSNYLGPNGIKNKLAPQPLDVIEVDNKIKIEPVDKKVIEPTISMGNSKQATSELDLASYKQPVSLDYKVCPYCSSKLGLEATTCFLCGKRVVDK
ncbi:MAG: DUF5684 domain-containing protein [Bacilli bacterium]